MGNASRRKGADGERELAAWLTDRGFPAHRGRQFKGSADSPDVVCAELSKIHIECKRSKRAIHLGAAMIQAIGDAADGATPIVMHRRDRGEWLVTMRAEDWLKRFAQ